MVINIIDHFMHDEPIEISGSPLQVEEQLREHYNSTFRHIPIGDLGDIIATLRRMSGVELYTDTEVAPMRQEYDVDASTDEDDPWVREIDFK